MQWLLGSRRVASIFDPTLSQTRVQSSSVLSLSTSRVSCDVVIHVLCVTGMLHYTAIRWHPFAQPRDVVLVVGTRGAVVLHDHVHSVSARCACETHYSRYVCWERDCNANAEWLGEGGCAAFMPPPRAVSESCPRSCLGLSGFRNSPLVYNRPACNGPGVGGPVGKRLL